MSETDILNKRTREIKERLKLLDAQKTNLGVSNMRVGQKNPFDGIGAEEKALFLEYTNLPEYLPPMKFRRLSAYESLDGSIMIIVKNKSAIVKTSGFYQFRVEVKDDQPTAILDHFVDSYCKQQRRTVQPIEILSDSEIGKLEELERAKIAARKPETRKDIPTWTCECGTPNLDDTLVQNCRHCGKSRPKEELKPDGKLGKLKELLR